MGSAQVQAEWQTNKERDKRTQAHMHIDTLLHKYRHIVNRTNQ